MTGLFPERIATDIAVVERLCHENIDIQEYHKVCSTDEPDIDKVLKHIPSFEPHTNIKETIDFVDSAEVAWENGEKAEYVIRPQSDSGDSDEIVGGFRVSIDWELQTGDMGIWLRKPYWGEGYTRTLRTVARRLIFEEWNLELYQAVWVDGNTAVKKLIEESMKEVGGQYEGLFRNWTVDADGNPVDCHRFTITREQYYNRDDKRCVSPITNC